VQENETFVPPLILLMVNDGESNNDNLICHLEPEKNILQFKLYTECLSKELSDF